MTKIIGKGLKMTGKALKTVSPSLNALTLAKAICATVIAIIVVFFQFQAMFKFENAPAIALLAILAAACIPLKFLFIPENLFGKKEK